MIEDSSLLDGEMGLDFEELLVFSSVLAGCLEAIEAAKQTTATILRCGVSGREESGVEGGYRAQDSHRRNCIIL